MHDTVYVVWHETVYVVLHDTVRVVWHDTVRVVWNDTVHVVWQPMLDTVYVVWWFEAQHTAATGALWSNREMEVLPLCPATNQVKLN